MPQSTTPGDANVAFADLGLSEAVLAAVEALGYTEPTPVQAQAIPQVLAGHDLLAAAQTGTGKTAAFLLPTMSRLPHAARHHGPTMLVVTPTRELAQQIADVCSTIEKHTHHRSVTVVGGVGYEPQKAALRRGCDVLVTTPGRLVDLIEQGEARLGEVEVLVLDEADRMLDMGFLPQMRKIVGQTPASRQTLLFSATLDEKAIGGIRDLVSEPVTVEIAHKGTVAETIDQYALPVSLEAKNALLATVLKSEGTERVIVFTRTKHRADAACRRLRRAGITCAPIHGNRSQNQRERALSEFRDGKVDVLVATDVLARGIDVSDVRYVVNFDVPADPEDYIHRIGRTGRAGETGWALTFVTVNDAEDLFGIERLMGQTVPSYQPKVALELGEEPPALDPNRDAVAPAKAKGKKKRKKKRGINADGALLSDAEVAELTAAENGGRRRKGGTGKAGQGENGKPRGQRGGEAAGEPRKRRSQGSSKGATPKGGDKTSSPKSGAKQKASSKPKGTNKSKASGANAKPRRRVGDRAGRARGIY